MAKKTLAEAAEAILAGNLRANGDGDKFGAGSSQSGVSTPGQSGKAKDLGGPTTSEKDAGGESVDKLAKATPPGGAPPVGPEKGEKLSEEHDDDDDDDVSKAMGDIDNDGDHDMDDHDAEKKEKKDKKDVKEEADIPDIEPVSSKVAAYVKSKTGVSVSEDISAIFSGEKLSEEFKAKATKIYEAAVIATATKVCEGIESQYAELLETTTDAIQEELTEKVDDYLNYMVEEWVKDNEIAIEKGLRAELVEDFIGGLRTLFVEHFIDIPEDKVQVVEELTDKVVELEERLNEEINRGIAINKKLSEQVRTNVLRTVTEGLTETQVEKLNSLAEGVDFTDEEEYKTNLTTLRESYFPKAGPAKALLGEGLDTAKSEPVVTEDEKKVNPEMAAYVAAISKTRPV